MEVAVAHHQELKLAGLVRLVKLGFSELFLVSFSYIEVPGKLRLCITSVACFV